MRAILNEITASPKAFAEGLMKNGCQHNRYKMYTSMDRALRILLTGNLYLSNGGTWNDKQDRTQMKNNQVFGMCFSWSTVENIAMWMLYSGGSGKSGAMLDFPRKVMTEILNDPTAEFGTFEDGSFVCQKQLEASDFHLFLSDVVYTERIGDGKKVRLTMGEDHATVCSDILNGDHIYQKYYAWAYERECRLVLKPKEPDAVFSNACCSLARIKLSSAALRIMKENLYRSPVYKDATDVGIQSALWGEVDW